MDRDIQPAPGHESTSIDGVAADVSRTRDERQRSAAAPLASLREEPSAEAAWDEEIRRRLRDIDSGKTRLITGDEVLGEAERLLDSESSC
jgi:hypothetical protein